MMKKTSMTTGKKKRMKREEESSQLIEFIVHSSISKIVGGDRLFCMTYFNACPEEEAKDISGLKKYVRAYVDLMSLMLAQKRYEAENHQVLKNQEDLIPAYLERIPSDIYSGSDQRYGFSGGRFYSVGPDGIDERGEKALLLTDYIKKSTNPDYVLSGDIYIEKRPYRKGS